MALNIPGEIVVGTTVVASKGNFVKLWGENMREGLVPLLNNKYGCNA